MEHVRNEILRVCETQITDGLRRETRLQRVAPIPTFPQRSWGKELYIPSPGCAGGGLGWGQSGHANYFVPTTYFAMNLRSIEFFQRQTHHPWKEILPHEATA